MLLLAHPAVLTWLAAVSIVHAQSPSDAITPAPSATASDPPDITAVTDCHMHGSEQLCMAGSAEYRILTTPTGTEELPAQYTDCHGHAGDDIFCVDPDGDDVQIVAEGQAAASEEHEGEEHDEEESLSAVAAEATGGETCHFHAGVEHCGEDGEAESAEADSCERVNRDYNVGLRVGMLFVVLATSAFAVFTPIFIASFSRVQKENVIFMFLKQFGTGVIISTATIHLFTHATIIFGNRCLGVLKYEPTTAAIAMAGIFVSFVADYLGLRFVLWRQSKAHAANGTATDFAGEPALKEAHATGTSEDSSSLDHHARERSTPSTEKVNVWVLESGIIFHSLLIGLTLIVAGDSVFRTLLIVVIFHQMFEGIALGTQIGKLPSSLAHAAAAKLAPADVTPLWTKLLMGLAFALVTPVGMAIGLGVLDQFNGNDPSTIVAIGTLNALSAGILLWVGVVDMLARDWMYGDLSRASLARTALAGTGLVSGMGLMSLLGKWI